MPTELEDLVGFLHHGNTQIRQTAIENLLGYSTSQPSIFKKDQLTPVKDLKLLVRDYSQIAKNSLTILINLSDNRDREVLENIANDDVFLESLLVRVTNPKEPNSNLIAMLLSNLAKSDSLKRILKIKRLPNSALSSSKNAMDQLMDCFVKGADGAWNKDADFDYLAYFFADLAKYPEGRKYFVTKQDYDGVIPVSKLIVFTEHKSNIRRKGVASTIKNICFDTESHRLLLDEDEVNVLPYILLPMMGPEEYSEEEMLEMLPDLQLLPPDKKRDSEIRNIHTHVESLLLLTTTRHGREYMRKVGVYPVIRETHLHVDDEQLQDLCDRLVQLLMGDEEPEPKAGGFVQTKDAEEEEDDDDDKVVEIF